MIEAGAVPLAGAGAVAVYRGRGDGVDGVAHGRALPLDQVPRALLGPDGQALHETGVRIGHPDRPDVPGRVVAIEGDGRDLEREGTGPRRSLRDRRGIAH